MIVLFIFRKKKLILHIYLVNVLVHFSIVTTKLNSMVPTVPLQYFYIVSQTLLAAVLQYLPHSAQKKKSHKHSDSNSWR